MSADFSRLLAHLGDNLVEHAKRDGLNEVRTAIFLARGGHAPGEVCPSEVRTEQSGRAWCFTCERFHEPMEWTEGCTDDLA